MSFYGKSQTEEQDEEEDKGNGEDDESDDDEEDGRATRCGCTVCPSGEG